MRKLCVATGVLLLITACSHERASTPTRTIVTADGMRTVAPEMETTQVSDRATSCPEGMVLVEGDFCPDSEQECLTWLPGEHKGIGKLRCAEFKKPTVCKSKERKRMRFCMDVYEWPNRKGELPPVGKTWYDAKSQCEGVGKRLCTASEWTFACEGEDMKPYPYGDGYHRDDTACNIDKESMQNPDAPRSEWAANYRGVPSGSMDRCVSWAGVHDMTGNVDEWVNNVGGRSNGDPYFSGLKGGYWGPVRTRCRPMTTVHGPGFSFYQIGFRCCQDVK